MSKQRLLFASTIFLASFLLFLVEPIAARQLLPVLGGSAAVWITCLVFFQTTLLLGYLYAHGFAGRQRQVAYIALLVASCAFAIAWATAPPLPVYESTHPTRTVFRLLGSWIGLPFLMLSATSPLLQVWWSRLENTEIPYRLYALSNLASLLALAAYPSLVEPNLTLHVQRIAWFCGFLLFSILSIVLAVRVAARSAGLSPAVAPDESTRAAASEERVSSASANPDSLHEEALAPRAPLSHLLLWFFLPMGAAMQLCTVTSYLTANVAAIPLLWILPLGVYLITIILAFQFRVILPWGIIARFMVVMLAALAWSLSKTNTTWPLWLSITFFLIELFFACIFCHSGATRLRPQRASEATLFYLLFAAGGAAGSFLIGIGAPLAFNVNLDLPITFLVTALLALAINWQSNWSQRMLWIVASAGMVVVTFMVRHSLLHDATVTVRNFYASLRVTQDLFSYPGTTVRTLMNGNIQHGTQIYGTDELRRTPTTYYAPDSGVGLAVRFCCGSDNHDPRHRRIGVIGLGAGTIAAYGKAGDHITFYDINPAVQPIARNVFTYIRESPAKIDVVEGDARTSLAREEPQHFDVLVIDAFSGDAIPIHLLTREALDLYRRHLAPGGILAFHISNRHVDLEPPIAALAASAGMEARHVYSLGKDSPGEYSSTWMLVTDNAGFFLQPDLVAHAFFPDTKPGLKPWTDDYSALLPVLRW